MSSKLLIMAGLAVVFGGTSYYAGNQYLEGQTQARLSQLESNGASAIDLVNVVVASKSMAFGEKLTAEDLKLTPWPKNAVPEGTYATIEEVVANGNRKVIQPIEPNEPVLDIKITGENSRGGLAGIIADGMRAVTIPVNMVDGVGGFVLPGDRVDIIYSQRDRKSGKQTATVIMENVKVLSIDQDANSRANSPKIAKSVTLETDASGAQRLALANNSGKLSLLLRGAGDTNSILGDTVSFDDIGGNQNNEDGVKPEPNEKKPGFLSFLQSEAPKTRAIKVVKGSEAIVHTVPIDTTLRQTIKK